MRVRVCAGSLSERYFSSAVKRHAFVRGPAGLAVRDGTWNMNESTAAGHAMSQDCAP